MKHFFLLALISTFVACGQTSTSDDNNQENSEPIVISLKNFNLEGDVTSITQEASIVNIDEDANILGEAERNTYHSMTTYLFNDKGVWQKSMFYMNNDLYSTIDALFSENGDYNGAVQKDSKGNITGEIKLVEFTDTKRIEETYFNDKLQFRSTQKLNNHIPQEITNETFLETTITTKTTNSFDDNNRIIEYSIEDISNGESHNKFQYKVKYLEFDENGNWTKRLDYIEGENEGIMYTRSFE